MKLRKNILSLSCTFIFMCTLPSSIKANEEGRYFITIEEPKADQYVSDTVGDFINLESNSLGYYLNNTSNVGNHALLIHGINGNKVHVWNLYSEWTSSASTYKAKGITFSMHRYGHFIK